MTEENVANLISKSDALDILELIEYCAVTNQVETTKILSYMTRILEFEHCVYGLATIKNDKIASYQTLNLSYPAEWLHLYEKRHFHEIDPVCIHNFSYFTTQFWRDTYEQYGGSIEFISAACDFGLKNGFTSGVRTLRGAEGSIFSIAGPLVNVQRSRYIIRTLTPHLHEALHKTLISCHKRSFPDLSAREIEILNWIKKGKSSWDISIILKISERTVKFHVCNIKNKLDAVTRPHALAIAMAAGLIDTD